MEGERYKKSPELLLQAVNHMPKMEAPCQFITWKRFVTSTNLEQRR
jgi:hypothetical protein